MTDPAQYVVKGQVAGARMMANGDWRVSVDFPERPPGDFLELGRIVAVALLRDDVPEPDSEPDYGHEAEALRLSSFMRTPAVWAALGTDREYLEWVKDRANCVAHSITVCGGDIVAAHVRRIADGAGTGIKPKYSAVPMCHEHHADQHAQGESVVGGKEYLDKQRIKCVTDWAWERLRETMGVDSMKHCEPDEVLQWAERHAVDQYLPYEYTRGLHE